MEVTPLPSHLVVIIIQMICMLYIPFEFSDGHTLRTTGIGTVPLMMNLPDGSTDMWILFSFGYSAWLCHNMLYWKSGFGHWSSQCQVSCLFPSPTVVVRRTASHRGTSDKLRQNSISHFPWHQREAHAQLQVCSIHPQSVVPLIYQTAR